MWCGRWDYVIPICLLFVSSTSGIVFNPSAGAITADSQSSKDTDPYLSSSSTCRTPATESRYSFYRTGRVNLESERTTEINICRGWDSNPQPLDRVRFRTTRPPPLPILTYQGHLQFDCENVKTDSRHILSSPKAKLY